MAAEIRRTIETSSFDWHELLVDNYVGNRLVRWGWGASFGKAAYPGLFRRGVKVWGTQRVHPSLTWSGKRGPMLDGQAPVMIMDEDTEVVSVGMLEILKAP